MSEKPDLESLGKLLTSTGVIITVFVCCVAPLCFLMASAVFGMFQ